MKYILILLVSFAFGQNGMSYQVSAESDTTLVQTIQFYDDTVSKSRWYFKADDYDNAFYMLQTELHLQYLNDTKYFHNSYHSSKN